MSAVHEFDIVSDRRLHHLDFGGSGHPIVLVHGVLGQAWMWHSIAPELAHLGHVVAPDLRGYGQSQWSSGNAYATADFADDLAEVADQRGWRQISLVGFSLGGLVGLALWDSRPDLVGSLVMIDLAASSDQPADGVPQTVMVVPDHAAAMREEEKSAPGITALMRETMAYGGWRPGPDGALARVHDPLFARYWPFRTEDWWSTVERFSPPLLFINGSDSPVCSAAQAQRMVDSAPNAVLETIADGGHLMPLTHPLEVGRAVGSFITMNRTD